MRQATITGFGIPQASDQLIWFVVTSMYAYAALLISKIENKTPIHTCNQPIRFWKENNW